MEMLSTTERKRNMRRGFLGIALSLSLVLGGQLSASAAAPETADVWDQGESDIYAPGGAALVRQANGISVSVTMPTPTPGTYKYPDGTEEGGPEVFTLWMFVFNHPENCAIAHQCGPGDMTNLEVEFGAYNPGGHVGAGSTLNIAGRVGVGDLAGAPPGIIPHPLSNPEGAAVHLAVTSHGGLDPQTLPTEFRVPTGNGGCGCWWLAFFD